MKARTSEFLSAAALARRLDLPQPRLAALLKSGQLKPDAIAGRTQLFDPSRLAELAGQVADGRRIRASRLCG